MNGTAEVELRALVAGYDASAAVDDYDDRTHQRFGATRLEILAPERLKHRILAIYHDSPVDNSSPWRAIGSVLSFSLDQELLEEGVQVFAAAARGVRAGL
jgi:hypothetical protein